MYSRILVQRFPFVYLMVFALAITVGSHLAWSANNGEITVDNNTTECTGASGAYGFDFPAWEVIQGSIVHINISPAFSICTAGPSNKLNDQCTVSSDCNSTSGNCQSDNNGVCTGTCSAGNVGANCTSNAACNVAGVCDVRRCVGGSNAGAACSNNGQCNSNVCGPRLCSAGNVGAACSNDGACNVAGTCSFAAATCTAGKTGQSCTTSSQCNTGTCSPGSPNNAGGACDPANGTNGNLACNILGTCGSALNTFCDSGPESIFISGHHGTCTTDGDCEAGQTCDSQTCNLGTGTCSISNLSCTVDADCPSLCSFNDELVDGTRVGTGDIDVCYNVREDWCGDAIVRYCEDTGSRRAVVQNPQSQVYVNSHLTSVDSEGELADCVLATDTCVNEVGSICCGLTQGAYGAPNSVATSLGTVPSDPCSGDQMGFLVAAFCGGCDPFDTDPNDTTVGSHPSRSVTIGPGTDFFDSLNSLISYLPSGGPAKQLSNVGDKHYPPNVSPGGNSKGDGGGVLTGQAMATSMNVFLSDTCNPAWGGVIFQSGYTPDGFGGFVLPDQGVLLCTQRSGPNKVLGDDDDVCQAFAYADCVAGQSVGAVLAAANEQLGTGTNSLGCTAAELNNALSNINVQFDQCGEVIDCGAVVTPGTFTCP